MRRLLLSCGVAGPAAFVLSFLIQGGVRQGYDPLRHPVSALALDPDVGWIQSATFLVTGACVIAYALGLRLAGAGVWTPILVGVTGIGLIGAGLFVCDPINGYPPGSPVPAPRTVHGIVHDQFSTPVFTALPAAFLVMAHRLRRAGRVRARGWSIAAAVAFWVCFILAALGFNRFGPFIATGGLWQRLCLIIGFGWLAVLAIHHLRARGRPSPGSASRPAR